VQFLGCRDALKYVCRHVVSSHSLPGSSHCSSLRLSLPVITVTLWKSKLIDVEKSGRLGEFCGHPDQVCDGFCHWRTMQITTRSGPRSRYWRPVSHCLEWPSVQWNLMCCARQRAQCSRYWNVRGRPRTAHWSTWRLSSASTSPQVSRTLT